MFHLAHEIGYCCTNYSLIEFGRRVTQNNNYSPQKSFVVGPCFLFYNVLDIRVVYNLSSTSIPTPIFIDCLWNLMINNELRAWHVYERAMCLDHVKRRFHSLTI